MAGNGLTLDRYLQSKGALPPAQAGKVVLSIVRQLKAGGVGGIIAPERIALGADRSIRLLPGDDALPPVVEFPAYVAPEVARGGEPDDAATLYSLGCTLFELVTGTPPFSADSPKALLKAQISANAPRLRDAAPNAPASLDAVVSSLLAKEPADRPASLEHLESRLAAAIHAGGATGKATEAPARKAPARPAAAAPTRSAGRAPAAPAAGTARAKAKSGAVRRAAGARASGAEPDRSAGARGSRGGGRRTRGANSRRGSGRRGGRVGADRQRAVEDDLDSGDYGLPPRRPTPYISIAGALLGLVIGIFFVHKAKVNAERSLAAIPEQDRVKQEKQLADRIAGWKQEFAERGLQIDRLLKGGSAIPAKRRYEEYRRKMDVQFDSPKAKLLSDAVYKAWEERERDVAMVEEEAGGGASAFTKSFDEARSLREKGQLGDALAVLEELLASYPRRKEEIYPEVDDISAELTSRWDKDQKRVERLTQASKGPEAVRVLQNAMQYGDSAIRNDASKLLEQLQGVVALQQKNTPGGDRKRDPEPGDDDDDDWGDDDDDDSSDDDDDDSSDDDDDDWGDDDDDDSSDDDDDDWGDDDDDDWGDDDDDDSSDDDDWGDDDDDDSSDDDDWGDDDDDDSSDDDDDWGDDDDDDSSDDDDDWGDDDDDDSSDDDDDWGDDDDDDSSDDDDDWGDDDDDDSSDDDDDWGDDDDDDSSDDDDDWGDDDDDDSSDDDDDWGDDDDDDDW